MRRDRSRGRQGCITEMAGLPDSIDPLGIVRDELRGIWLRAVGEDFNRGRIACAQTFGEIRRDDDEAAQVSGNQVGLQRRLVKGRDNFEIVGRFKCLDEVSRVGARVLNHHSNADRIGIEGYPEPEQQEKDQWQDECDQDG